MCIIFLTSSVIFSWLKPAFQCISRPGFETTTTWSFFLSSSRRRSPKGWVTRSSKRTRACSGSRPSTGEEARGESPSRASQRKPAFNLNWRRKFVRTTRVPMKRDKKNSCAGPQTTLIRKPCSEGFLTVACSKTTIWARHHSETDLVWIRAFLVRAKSEAPIHLKLSMAKLSLFSRPKNRHFGNWYRIFPIQFISYWNPYSTFSETTFAVYL